LLPSRSRQRLAAVTRWVLAESGPCAMLCCADFRKQPATFGAPCRLEIGLLVLLHRALSQIFRRLHSLSSAQAEAALAIRSRQRCIRRPAWCLSGWIPWPLPSVAAIPIPARKASNSGEVYSVVLQSLYQQFSFTLHQCIMMASGILSRSCLAVGRCRLPGVDSSRRGRSAV
jgi:hypothetical protein